MNTDNLEKGAVDSALKGDWHSAILYNKQLLKHGFEKPNVYNRLGKAYSQTGDWVLAIKSFEKALMLDPINSVAEKGLGQAKNEKIVGSPALDVHKETLIKDASTSQIIELHINNPEINEKYYFVSSKKPLYYLLVRSSDNKKFKEYLEQS